MPEAISDTGPILHLREIGRLETLSTLHPLILPDLVWEELQVRGVSIEGLEGAGVRISVSRVEPSKWREAVHGAEPVRIQPADAQVFVLARSRQFQNPVLTDDLSLRRLLENHGALVTGTVGILVRAYGVGKLRRADLEKSVDDLFEKSTLHLSRGFRAYIRRLLLDLS